MAKTGVTGIQRIINAAGYSWKGVTAAYQNEAAFRQELWLCILLVPAAFYFGENPADQSILIISLLFVLLVELLNSAIEAVVDRFGDEIHPLSGRAKDMGSASVLLAIIICMLTWFAILV